MRTFRILWNHAADDDRFPDLGPNPARRLRRQWFAEPKRTRVVRADQMPAFHAAVLSLPNEVARDWIRLMMFSGMRRSEAASLRWDDVDFAQQVIHVPAVVTKPGRGFDLPMSDYIFDMLVKRRALGDGQFVFPGNAQCGHIVDTGRPIKQIEELCGIRISAHDLRRGYIRLAEALDLSPYTIKALVNHAINDVTGGYIGEIPVERLREPVQRMTCPVFSDHG
jgi:integrase